MYITRFLWHNSKEHVKDVTFFTTLAGYIHWQLTGEKVKDTIFIFPEEFEKNLNRIN